MHKYNVGAILKIYISSTSPEKIRLIYSTVSQIEAGLGSHIQDLGSHIYKFLQIFISPQYNIFIRSGSDLGSLL